MKKLSSSLLYCTLLVAPLALVACGKKTVETAPVAVEPAAAPAPVAAAPSATPPELTSEQRDMARKQAKLEYTVMEDKYMSDPRAQWAASATSSSSYQKGESEARRATSAIGPIDDKQWRNDQTDIGFDWIELGYAKPVNATEVRMVIADSATAESLTKVELQDTDGKWNTIWSGISETKVDERGPRTWLVRSFEKTAYKVKAVKYTFANTVSVGHKEVEAAQLLGD